MTIEQKENFEDFAVYTVEIPTKEQNTLECNEAKHKEIENLVKFDVFEEVDDVGQERFSSRWVVTQKEKADGKRLRLRKYWWQRDFKRKNLHSLICQLC